MDTKAALWVLEKLRPDEWGKNWQIDVPQEGGVLVVGATPKKLKNCTATAASVRARKWKSGSRMISEGKHLACRAVAHCMRVGRHSVAHAKSEVNQVVRMLLTNRRTLRIKQIDIENEIRGTLGHLGSSSPVGSSPAHLKPAFSS